MLDQLEAVKGAWERNGRGMPTIVLRSPAPSLLDDIISSVACSNIDRRVDGVVSLFCCHVTPSCKNQELKQHKDVTRIDIHLVRGEIHLWNLIYSPSKPDVVIENAVLRSPVKS